MDDVTIQEFKESKRIFRQCAKNGTRMALRDLGNALRAARFLLTEKDIEDIMMEVPGSGEPNEYLTFPEFLIVLLQCKVKPSIKQSDMVKKGDTDYPCLSSLMTTFFDCMR